MLKELWAEELLRKKLTKTMRLKVQKILSQENLGPKVSSEIKKNHQGNSMELQEFKKMLNLGMLEK